MSEAKRTRTEIVLAEGLSSSRDGPDPQPARPERRWSGASGGRVENRNRPSGGGHRGGSYNGDRRSSDPFERQFTPRQSTPRSSFGSDGGFKRRASGEFTPRIFANQQLRPTEVITNPVIKIIKDILIKTINDNDVKNALKTVAKTLDLTTSRDDIAELFSKFLCELSVECPVIATLVALISKSNRGFTGVLLERLSYIFVESLQEDNTLLSKLCLRAYACMTAAKMLSPESMVHILQPLLAVASESLQPSGRLSPAACVTVYLLGSTLPWCASALAKSADGLAFLQSAVKLFEKMLPTYKSPYDCGEKHSVFCINLSAFAEDADPDAAACRDSVWAAADIANSMVNYILNTPENERDSNILTGGGSLQFPWLLLDEELNAAPGGEDTSFFQSLDALLNSRLAAMISSSCVGSRTRLHSGRAVANPRRAKEDDPTDGAFTKVLLSATAATCWFTADFKIFEDETSKLSKEQRFFCSEYTKDILRFFEPYRSDDGTMIGSLNILTTHLLDLSKLYPKGVNVEFGIIETILSMLTQSPAHYPLLLGRVVVLLSREKTRTIPSIVLRGFDLLYSMFPAMEMTSIRQLADFLAFYLSNFGMDWPRYSSYAQDMHDEEDTDFNNQKFFIAIFIDKCVRLVGANLMMEKLPKSIHYLISSSSAKPLCSFFGDESLVEDSSVQTLSSDLKYNPVQFASSTRRSSVLMSVLGGGKLEIQEDTKTLVASFKKNIEESATDILKANYTFLDEFTLQDSRDVYAAGIFWQGLLKCAGEKHLFLIVESHAVLLRSLTTNPESQKILLHAHIEAKWSDAHSFCVLLDTMMQHRVLSTNVVATWLFDQGILQDIHCDHWVGSLVEITTQRSVDLVWEELSLRRLSLDRDSMEVDIVGSNSVDESGVRSAAFVTGEIDSTGDDVGINASKDVKSDSGNYKTPAQIEAEFAAKLEDAVIACRKTYKTSIEGLVRACSVARSSVIELMGEDAFMVHPQFSTVFSQLKSTLRMFHANEFELLREFTDQESSKLTLTAVRDVIDTFGKSMPPEVEAYLLQFL